MSNGTAKKKRVLNHTYNNNKTEAIAWKYSFTFVAAKRFSVFICIVLYIYEKLGDHISMTVVWCAAVATATATATA